MGKDSSAPPAPDYAAAAQAQGAANKDAAIASAKLSNPNIISPYGSQTVTYGRPVFDEAGYNAALAKYNAGGNIAPAPNRSDPRFNNYFDQEAGLANQFDSRAFDQAMQAWQQGGGQSGPPPTKEQFTKTYDELTPTVTQTLTPTAQKTVDAQQQVQLGLANLGLQGTNKAAGVLNSPFSFGGQVNTALDTSGIAKMPVNAGTTGQAAIMDRLDPSLQRQRVSTETQLINQGLRPGMEAYDNAIKLLGQQENDARQQAVLQGLNLDMGANAQGFNQALQGGQFGNTANQQALAQALQLRSQPLNEITALMSGSQIQNPQFQGYTGANVAPAPVMAGAQAQGQAGLNLYNTQQAADNAMTSGLFQLGGLAASGYAGSPTGSAAIGRLFSMR